MQVDLLRQTLTDLGVEIGIPSTWARDGDHGGDVRFVAEQRHGYATNVTLSAGRLDPPTPAGFEQLIDGFPASLADRQPGLETVWVRRFAQHGRPACAFRLRWTPHQLPPGAPRIDTFEQLIVFLVIDPDDGRMLQLHATTIAPLAQDDLPLLLAIIETARPLSGDGAHQERS